MKAASGGMWGSEVKLGVPRLSFARILTLQPQICFASLTSHKSREVEVTGAEEPGTSSGGSPILE